MKISVIGLGYVGLPLASLLARDFDVVGFDVDQKRVSQIASGMVPISEPGLSEAMHEALQSGHLVVTSEISKLNESDAKIITVGTPYDPDRDHIDYSQLGSALDLIQHVLKSGDVIILKSTVPPGTTSGYVKTHLEKAGWKVPEQIGLVFSPERIVEGQAVKDFLSLPKIIGATDNRSLAIAEKIISTLGGTITTVSNPETAEFVKMIDNYVRFSFLGITNEIALVAERIGVDVYESIKAAKTDYPRNSGILIPGPGVGGSCLNKDPYILRSEMREKGLKLQMVEAAREVNDNIPFHISRLISDNANGKKKVLVVGIAFKGETDDTRYTPATKIVSSLKEAGFTVTLTDPYIREFLEQEVKPDLLNAADSQEIILLLSDHSVYRALDLNALKNQMASNPLLVDTRNMVDKNEATKLGFEYISYGRGTQ